MDRTIHKRVEYVHKIREDNMRKKGAFKFVLQLMIASLIFTSCATTYRETQVPGPTQPPVEGKIQNYTGPKKRVCIVDFANKSEYGQGQLGRSASDILATELFKSGAFILVERNKMQQLLNEQAFGQTGAIDPATAAKAGALLGCSAIVTGSITQFGVKVLGTDYGIYKQKVQKADCTVDVRVVDTSTGQVLFADSGKGEYETKITQVLGMGQYAGYDEVLGQQALRAAITKFIDNLIQQLQSVEWSGRIAGIQGNRVYINAGQKTGLNIGDELIVASLGEEIRDPQTGLVIGRAPGPVLGRVRIIGFFGDDGSVATVESGSGFKIGDQVKLQQ
jgi:curli biogenesis system outer membrane secretion channel CsgG